MCMQQILHCYVDSFLNFYRCFCHGLKMCMCHLVLFYFISKLNLFIFTGDITINMNS